MIIMSLFTFSFFLFLSLCTSLFIYLIPSYYTHVSLCSFFLFVSPSLSSHFLFHVLPLSNSLPLYLSVYRFYSLILYLCLSTHSFCIFLHTLSLYLSTLLLLLYLTVYQSFSSILYSRFSLLLLFLCLSTSLFYGSYSIMPYLWLPSHFDFLSISLFSFPLSLSLYLSLSLFSSQIGRASCRERV